MQKIKFSNNFKIQILNSVTNSLYDRVLSLRNIKILPLDESLIELGIIDSFGIIELIEFLEKRWCIEITNVDLSKENFGSVNRIVNFIYNKKIIKNIL